ncbi:MAG: flippase-like domain-containing protein [Magnetococcales bacterium]|nr:flippase-like domain-containing protein [Magnetococcales bacterium]
MDKPEVPSDPQENFSAGGKRARAGFWFGLKLAVAVGIVTWLVQRGKLDPGMLLATGIHPWLFAGVVVFNLGVIVVAAYRWRLLLECQGICLPFFKTIQITFIGLFFNSFLPGGGVGGDALRIAYGVRAAPDRRSAAVISIFVDRLVGLYTLFVLCVVVMVLNPGEVLANRPLQLLGLVAVVLVVGAPLGVVVIHLVWRRSERLRELFGRVGILRRVEEAIVLYRRGGWRLVGVFGVSLLMQILGILSLVVLAILVGIDGVSPLGYAFVTPWTWLANVLPVSPGGIGVGEAAFDQVCRWVEPVVSGAAYGTIFFVYRISVVLASLPGLAAYLFYRDDVESALKEAEG